MRSIKLICVGKLKEKFYLEACREYVKRLGGFGEIAVVELTEEAGRPDELQREAKAIREQIPAGAYVIAMCIEGRPMSSVELAQTIKKAENAGRSRLCLLIGGSEGLEESLKKEADLRLSMSPMTFPHHLARVMVLEQVYRACSINAGSKYHK